MLDYPDCNILPNYQKLLPRIAQSGPFWCIPAGIENIIKYVGIHNLTQEEMVLKYCYIYGDRALVIEQGQQYYRVSVSRLTEAQLLPIALKSLLVEANFGSFKGIVEEFAQFTESDFELVHLQDINEQNEYVVKIKSSISKGEPVLVPTTNTDRNSHIRVVVGYNNHSIDFYDPGLDKICTVEINSIKFNTDMLLLRKRLLAT